METAAPPCIILNVPQLAQNIGAVARVMANFGLADLRLVNPRDGWPQEHAWAAASGAEWPLNAARVYDRVEDAIADLHLVYATTARPRELQLPILTPREAAANLSHEVGEGRSVGLLFGGERSLLWACFLRSGCSPECGRSGAGLRCSGARRLWQGRPSGSAAWLRRRRNCR